MAGAYCSSSFPRALLRAAALLLVSSLWLVKAAPNTPCITCLQLSVKGRVGAPVTIDQCKALAKLVTAGWGDAANQATDLSTAWACITDGFTATADGKEAKLRVCAVTTEAGAAKLNDYFKANSPLSGLAGYLYTATGDAGLLREVYLRAGCTKPITSPTVKQSGPPPNVPCSLCLTASAFGIQTKAPATDAQCQAFSKSLVGPSGWADVIGADEKTAPAFTCKGVISANKATYAQLSMCASDVPYSSARDMLAAYQGSLESSVDTLGKLLADAVPNGGLARTFNLEYVCRSGSVNVDSSVQYAKSYDAGCVPGVCDCADKKSCEALIGEPVSSLLGARRSLLAMDGDNMGTVQCCAWHYSGCSNSGIACAKQQTARLLDEDEPCTLCVESRTTGRVGTAITKAQCDVLATSYSKEWAAKLVTGFDATMPFTCDASDPANSIEGTAAEPKVTVCATQPFKTSDAIVSKYASEYANTVGNLGPLLTKAIINGGKAQSFTVKYNCDSNRSRQQTTTSS